MIEQMFYYVPLSAPDIGTNAVAQFPYAELHSHSNFSFLDGASPVEDLVERAVELGLTGLAITDHLGLYGVVRFAAAAEAAGLHPVIGVEVELLDAAVADPLGERVFGPRSGPRRIWGRRGPATPRVRSGDETTSGDPPAASNEGSRRGGHRRIPAGRLLRHRRHVRADLDRPGHG
jgi:hypothetical protein